MAAGTRRPNAKQHSPPFAPPACYVLDSPGSPYDHPKRIITPDYAAAEDNLTSMRAVEQLLPRFAVTDWQ